MKKLGELAGQEIDMKLYGKQYSTAASKLGNQDANKLLADWCKKDDSMKDFDYANAILNDTKKKIPDNKTSCCQIFALNRIVYDNPLLNHSDIVKKQL